MNKEKLQEMLKLVESVIDSLDWIAEEIEDCINTESDDLCISFDTILSKLDDAKGIYRQL